MARAEAVLALSVGLGLRAKELAGLRWADVTTRRGVSGKSCTSRRRVHQGRPDARRVRVLARAAARPGKVWRAARGAERPGLAGRAVPEPEGRGPMTACSMARFLRALYREAGIAGRPRTAGCGR